MELPADPDLRSRGRGSSSRVGRRSRVEAQPGDPARRGAGRHVPGPVEHLPDVGRGVRGGSGWWFAALGWQEAAAGPPWPAPLASAWFLAGVASGGRHTRGRREVPVQPRDTFEENELIQASLIDLLERLHDVEENGEPRYERIVVVGHSLGSVMAYDAVTLMWARHHRQLLFPPPADEGRAPPRPSEHSRPPVDASSRCATARRASSRLRRRSTGSDSVFCSACCASAPNGSIVLLGHAIQTHPTWRPQPQPLDRQRSDHRRVTADLCRRLSGLRRRPA